MLVGGGSRLVDGVVRNAVRSVRVCLGLGFYTGDYPYTDYGVCVHHTQMVASESETRIQTSLVAKWPEAIDVKDGIFIPSRVEKWHRELTSALRTRALYVELTLRAPTIEDLCDQFPNEHVDDIMLAFDEMLIERHFLLRRTEGLLLVTFGNRCGQSCERGTLLFYVDVGADAIQ